MPLQSVKIETILGGVTPIENYAQKGQGQSFLAIDPELPKDDSSTKASGMLRPAALQSFSSATVNGAPMFIETQPKTEVIYTYLTTGRLISYSSSLGSETNVGTPTSGAGNGMAYYDNYIYLATPTDISRYGPLDGTAAISNTYWTSTLSLSALTNTTYPSLRGVTMPNHVMHRHTDDKLYFCDVLSNTTANTNKGALHYIYTSKASVEGDTNAGASYNALDFDYGEYPTCLETYNTFLAVGLIEGTGTTTLQKPAKVSFWDTTSTSFQQITSVELPDPLITAMKNMNGSLYVFTGNASGGFRVLRFSGGYTYQEIYYSPEGMPPLAGAVDHFLNRLIWGGYITDPVSAAVVLSSGGNQAASGLGIHRIYRATSADTTNQTVTAVKYVLQSNNSQPSLIAGWRDGTTQGLDKKSTTYQTSIFRSEVFRVGMPFRIHRIRLTFAQAIATNMTLTPKLYIDDGSSSETLTVINSTNYTGSERNVHLYPTIYGKHNFFLELTWSGTALLTVDLPIEIEFETIND